MKIYKIRGLGPAPRYDTVLTATMPADSIEHAYEMFTKEFPNYSAMLTASEVDENDIDMNALA